MRVPLKVSNTPEMKIGFSSWWNSYTVNSGSRWSIDNMNSVHAEKAAYVYSAMDDENKFFENGRIYNADGSIADNELLSKYYYFYDFAHASLNKLVEQKISRHLYDINYLYGLNAGNYDNLKRIIAIRDRLNVSDWVALLIAGKLADEDTVNAALVDVPDLFDAYPAKWVLNVLGINPDDINNFGDFGLNGARNPALDYNNRSFSEFCKIIELERQHVSSDVKIGAVI